MFDLKNQVVTLGEKEVLIFQDVLIIIIIILCEKVMILQKSFDSQRKGFLGIKVTILQERVVIFQK